MLVSVFPEDFNLASKVVVGTLNKLELTYLFMLLDVLSECFLAAFVIALNDFEKTSFIMHVYVFVNQNWGASEILADNSSEHAICFVLFKVFSF